MTKKFIDSQGDLSTKKSDILRFLFGIRYLTTNEITFTVEYYHNGGGIDEDDAKNFFRFVDRAHDTFLDTGDSSQLDKAARLSQGALAPRKSTEYSEKQNDYKVKFMARYYFN